MCLVLKYLRKIHSYQKSSSQNETVGSSNFLKFTYLINFQDSALFKLSAPLKSMKGYAPK